MTVYIDDLFETSPYKSKKWKWKQACHLVADTKEELLEFARKLGLNLAWFQNKPGHLPHFDITANKRKEAIACGAKELSTIEMGRFIRTHRNPIKNKEF